MTGGGGGDNAGAERVGIDFELACFGLLRHVGMIAYLGSF